MSNFLNGLGEIKTHNDQSELGSIGSNKEDKVLDFLEGIEKASIDLYLKRFIDNGIIAILEKVKKNKNESYYGKFLSQPEMKLLKEFRESYPELTLNELEGFK